MTKYGDSAVNLNIFTLGGWLSGEIFDLTGSYTAAFAHGIAWNLLNLSIAAWLITRNRGQRPQAMAAA